MVRLTLVLVVVAAIAPFAAAHAPPPPRDFETRLITDQNDDCGEHGTAGCNGSHDLLGLNLREAYDADRGAILVWALWMAPGAYGGADAEDRIQATAEGRAVEIQVTTRNDASFTATHAYRIGGPYPLLLGGQPDQNRFGIDLYVSLDDLGLGLGDELRGFRVESFAGSTAGDVMPGTYVQEDGSLAPKGPSELANGVETLRQVYELRGPAQYVSVRLPTGPVLVPPGSGASTALEVTSRSSSHSQEVTLRVAGGDGVSLTVRDANETNASDSLEVTFALGPKEARWLSLDLTARAGAEANVTVEVETDAGGRIVAGLLVRAEDAGEDDSLSAPGTAASLVAVGVLGALWRTRSRRAP